MAKQKNSFIIYQSWEDGLHLLSLEERGQVFTNLFNFHNGKEVVLNTPMLQMFWKMIEYNLTHNAEKYKIASENGSKGGAPKGNSNAKKQPNSTEINLIQPNLIDINQNQPKSSEEKVWLSENKLNDNDNDNDNDNVNENENVNEDVNGNDSQTSTLDLEFYKNQKRQQSLVSESMFDELFSDVLTNK